MSSCAAALAVARRQHGVITVLQLRAAGLSRNAIAHRVRSGWLRRLHRGVYLIGPLVARHTHAMAAVLAYGDEALLSHHPAAVLWGFRPAHAAPMHVTVTSQGAHSRPGIAVHRAAVHPADRARRDGVPTTSPARTLLDLATAVSTRDLSRAADEARVHHLVTDLSLNEQFQRYPHHRGAAALTKAIQTEPRLSRSEAERRLLELIRGAGLPEPETNVRVGRHEVDFLWRAERLVVEVDGYAFHSSRDSFERDRRRDAELAARRIRVMRVTWRQITGEPTALVATLALATARP